MHNKAFKVAQNLKYDGYQIGLAGIFYKYFDKRTSSGAIENENKSNKELAEELHKPVIREFNNRKVHSSFIDNIWSADLAEMQLITKFNKGICFYYVLLIFSVNMHGLPLKHKKCITITNAFQNSLKESNHKPVKIWVDKGSEFYNRSMKSWLEENPIKMYSTHDKWKSVVAKRFMRTSKNKIHKYMIQYQKMCKLIN